MNKKQVKIIFNGILIVATLLIVLDMINTVVLETTDVLEDVPHIMDTPPDESSVYYDYTIEDSIRDEIQRFKYVDSLYKISVNDSI
jgi:hypothetical protein